MVAVIVTVSSQRELLFRGPPEIFALLPVAEPQSRAAIFRLYAIDRTTIQTRANLSAIRTLALDPSFNPAEYLDLSERDPILDLWIGCGILSSLNPALVE